MPFQKLLLFFVVFSLSLLTIMAVEVSSPSSTLTHKRSRWTAQPPAPTPAPDLRRELFGKDARTCGVLEGYYTDAPPVCSGSASFCSFTGSSGYQGCCQDQSPDYCTFYTTCYAYSEQAYCTGSCTSSALVCPSSAPYCTQYAYQWEPDPPATHWTGFGCGSQPATIYAYAVNGIDQIQCTSTTACDASSSTSSSSSSTSSTASVSTTEYPTVTSTSTSSFSSSKTLLPPPTGASSSITTSTAASSATSSFSSSSSVANLSSTSQPHKHTAIIAGGVIGGLVVLVILFAAIIWWRIRGKRRARYQMAGTTQNIREIDHPWGTR